MKSPSEEPVIRLEWTVFGGAFEGVKQPDGQWAWWLVDPEIPVFLASEDDPS